MDNDLKSYMARLDERMERIEDDMGRLKHVLLEGNGTPAMTVRVALIEKDIERVKEERADKKVPRAVWLGIVISALLSIAALGAGFAN